MTQKKTDNDSIMAEMANMLEGYDANYITITPEGGKFDGLELTIRKVDAKDSPLFLQRQVAKLIMELKDPIPDSNLDEIQSIADVRYEAETD